MRRAIVTTSWDDGHKLDVRLADLLRRYKVTATFYVSPHDHEFTREDLLTDEQTKAIAADFEIGAHTMNHPRLTEVADEQARAEMADSKAYLEKLLKKPVTTFCYPGGNYYPKHVAMAREVGFAYARTVKRHFYRLKGALQESHTTVNAYNHYQDLWKILKFAHFNPFKVPYYFQWQNLAKAMFDKVQHEGGIFHLWGHSWEIDQHGDWEKLEEVLAYIGGHKDVTYVTNGELPALAKPRLLVAAPYYPPRVGGVEHYSYEMAKGAQANGYDVTVITSSDAKVATITDEDGIRIYRLPAQFKLMNTPINLAWYWQIKRIIAREDPDIVNAHAPVPFLPDMAMLAAKGRKRIMTYHAGSMKKGRASVDWLITLYEKVLLRRILTKADAIICSSDFVRNDFLRDFAERATTITPFVDTAVFTRRTTVPKDQNVLFVGNVGQANKGLQYLVKAISKLDGPVLHVVGEAEQTPDARVVYHGVLRGQELVKVLHEASVLVLPSTATESFGMVLTEAMACGVPVIGTNVGGIPLVIKDGVDGIIVPPADPAALAMAINIILTDHKKAAQFADRAYKKVTTQFTREICIAQYCAMLDKLQGGDATHGK